MTCMRTDAECFIGFYTSNGGLAYGNSKYGSETTTKKIWLDDVQCSDWNTNITECQHSKWGHNSCTHAKDAGVQCLISGKII